MSYRYGSSPPSDTIFALCCSHSLSFLHRHPDLHAAALKAAADTTNAAAHETNRWLMNSLGIFIASRWVMRRSCVEAKGLRKYERQ